MDAKLKADWCKALRSGEYRQAEGKLHDEDANAYCCLGVLCRVMGAEFGEAVQEGDEDSGPSSFDHVPVLNGKIISNNDDEELSEGFCKEVGIDDQSTLIGLNDGVGKVGMDNFKAPQPFSVIADYIEQNL